MGRVKMTIPNWRCNRVLNKFEKEKKIEINCSNWEKKNKEKKKRKKK